MKPAGKPETGRPELTGWRVELHREDSRVFRRVGRPNWPHSRSASRLVRQTIVGDKPALSAVADYASAGQQMVEYITWIDGQRSRVNFSARMPASALPGFQSRFDAMIQSAVVP
jgi:hypothetical protein